VKARCVAERIAELVPHASTNEQAGCFLQELVRRPGVRDVLELGFDQGVSTAYLAGALQETPGGRLMTLDRPKSLEKRPNVETVLRHVGVREQVEPVVESSYNWALMHLLARQATEQDDGRRLIEPCFDLCFIDGAHSWETDALAFSLVDLLLRPDRWIIFDDLDWTYGASPSLRSSTLVAAMTEEQRTTPQVRKVVELLVCSRPDYELHYVGRYALAYKRGDDLTHQGDLDEIVSANEPLIRELTIPRPASTAHAGTGRRRRRRGILDHFGI
jgi:predicted O-methyltransferase YrrM